MDKYLYVLEQFNIWWYNEGSGIQQSELHDCEEHTEKLCKIAWLNGAFSLESFHRLAPKKDK